MADIVGFGDAGAWVSLATGGGNFAAPAFTFAAFGADPAAGGWNSQDEFPRELADVNGDGTADIVAFGDAGPWVAVATDGGHFLAPFLALSGFGASPAAGNWNSQNQYPRQVADVNHDGIADIVAFGDAGTWVSLGTGGGHFAQPFLSLPSFGASPAAGNWTSQDQYPRELADVNGDGMADIVAFGYAGAWVSLATGGGHFGQPFLGLNGFGYSAAAGNWSSQTQYPRDLADVNGDGRSDIVGFGYAGGWVALGRSDGSFDQPSFGFNGLGYSAGAGGWISNDAYPRFLGEVTGDDKADVVGFGAAGVWVSASNDDASSGRAAMQSGGGLGDPLSKSLTFADLSAPPSAADIGAAGGAVSAAPSAGGAPPLLLPEPAAAAPFVIPF